MLSRLKSILWYKDVYSDWIIKNTLCILIHNLIMKPMVIMIKNVSLVTTCMLWCFLVDKWECFVSWDEYWVSGGRYALMHNDIQYTYVCVRQDTHTSIDPSIANVCINIRVYAFGRGGTWIYWYEIQIYCMHTTHMSNM